MSDRVGELPNIVVVVLDCVRARELPGGLHPEASLTFLQTLAKECVVFPRVATVAPWTVPSHASLFTGLYPWEHGVSIAGSLVIDPALPVLASRLRGAGYASISLSANHLVDCTLNLAQGFDEAFWNDSWRTFLRTSPGALHPPHRKSTNSPGSPDLHQLGVGRSAEFHSVVSVSLLRHPRALEFINSVASGLRPELANIGLALAPWIEGSLSTWLDEIPVHRPVFAFINYLDAHEPYLRLGQACYPGEYPPQVRQDRISFLAGRWSPKPRELDALFELYKGSLRLLDGRLRRLIEVLKSHDRWENTLFILTSDHGQAFGEGGLLFHSQGTHDAVLRVPLLVKTPYSNFSSRQARGWASLIDIAPTALSFAGLPPPSPSLGRDLRDIVEQDRTEAILATADGLLWGPFREWLPPERRNTLARVRGAAYLGDWKVTSDGTPEGFSAYELQHDPDELQNLWPSVPERVHDLGLRAAEVCIQMRECRRSRTADLRDERLRSWGYM